MAFIYKATNNKTGKSYVGRTSYARLSARIANHYYQARHKDHNIPFHNALRKYEREDFDWTILEECGKEEAGSREIYWIEQVNPEYNATRGGDGGTYGRECSEETRKKIAEGVGKKVRCIDTGVVYESAYEATRQTGLSGISRCCRGYSKTSGGLRWEFA
ncbi:intron-encoded endonuclease [Synechococcus phage S-CREM2]|nr:intron-encoded endonuclease [Synechococcus phage S-CREM2]